MRITLCDMMMVGVTLTLMSVGCQRHIKSGEQESETLVGAPPSRQDDPFASKTRPPDSARVSSSGHMDISEPLPKDRSQTPRPARVEETLPSALPEKQEEPITVVAPEPQLPEDVEIERAPDVYKCFSCVQICPLSDRSGDCSQSREDVICGWGTSTTKLDAQKLARAECDATLDMAREMPRFSRIDGTCPLATCVAK